MALSNKQQMFVNEYLKDFNATQAAIRAGYSEKSAAIIGWENIRKPNISATIKQRLEETAMSADEVLMRLAKQARGDMRDFLAVGENGIDVDLTYAIENNLTDLIKKISHRRTRTTKDDGVYEEEYIQLELHDAHAALVDLGKKHALFTDNNRFVDGDGNDVIPVAIVQPGLLKKLIEDEQA